MKITSCDCLNVKQEDFNSIVNKNESFISSETELKGSKEKGYKAILHKKMKTKHDITFNMCKILYTEAIFCPFCGEEIEVSE